MLDEENTNASATNDAIETAQDQPAAAEPAAAEAEAAPAPAKKAAARKTAAKKAPVKKAAAKKTTTRKTAAKKTAATEAPEGEQPTDAAATPTDDASAEAAAAPAKKAAAKRTRKAPAKKAAAKQASTDQAGTEQAELPLDDAPSDAANEEAKAEENSATAVVFQAPVKTTTRRRTTKKVAAPEPAADEPAEDEPAEGEDTAAEEKPKKKAAKKAASGKKKDGDTPTDADGATAEKSDKSEKADKGSESASDDEAATDENGNDENGSDENNADEGEGSGGPRRRRRRGGRRRRKSGDSNNDGASSDDSDDSDGDGDDDSDATDGNNESSGGSSRRRRRRRRAGDNGGGSDDDPENTVTRVRQGRSAEDQITAVSGSTRLEAKKQRRREGREAGRRRAPIVSEAEFLARRESVERVMVIRQREDVTQIAVLEDKVLVEHYVARESQTSLIGNVYVGRVQNVLPSMEAAFVDIGKGRNAVIYAGEVNWAALGHKDGQPRKIESVLSSGQSILVQVTKDPIGHKGARLTGQVSLPGRFLVYVPDGTTSGISRKLPDTERARLKSLLKEIVPDTAGVIVRTAAEGASEAELTQDVERLKARWEDIETKSKSGKAPQLLYGEPDLTLKVVRDLFTEDFTKLVIEGDTAWETVQGYVSHVAPDLEERLERHEPEDGRDAFATYRIDEQIAKGLDRKVWLPSGGSLIIDRTEAMTVVDVNTGKFTGSGGNLEETVTKNNLEAAEEIVRQLRLRDIGGIIVVDFIDMVLESNRDLVLRRLVECLGRDRTRHQVAEVTSLGLVQMTRKRIGTGLLEAFSEDCPHCQGRGLLVHEMPIEPKSNDDRGGRSNNRRSRGKGRGDQDNQENKKPSPKDVAAVARAENADKAPLDEAPAEDAKGDAGEKRTDTKDADKAPAEKSGAEKPAEQTDERDRSGAASGRGRGGRSTGKDADQAIGKDTDNDADQGTTPAADPAVTTADQPAAPTADQSGEQAGEPAKGDAGTPDAGQDGAQATQPKVVTRTRRRASRPTGVSTPPVEPVTFTASTPAPAAAPDEEAPAPKVVTRTRTRGGASRAAGSADAPATEAEADSAPVDVHVPIKKKGSRKH
ncbi:Rne/Rng family ribonuclease [Nocardioides sp. AE5]|uniref:Rne/Rng family ribonuclease n=1 Tax=Nocardioides sp. AE5 TaxID=2962573 RepID=UPI0028817956|nr:Rne/Rng family ribonuclease [Nocardioides sp. AE5]MDT0202815.1 Rne/Rng family ribonuclease [Nocardioides sp. AE5]